jgi:hypothetical protein
MTGTLLTGTVVASVPHPCIMVCYNFQTVMRRIDTFTHILNCIGGDYI